RLDFGGGRDQNVVLCFDEEKQCDDKKRCRPEANFPAIGCLRAGIDCGQNCSSADTSKCRYDNQPIYRAVHFTADEREEGHRCDLVHLLSSPVNTSAERLPPLNQ